ncbi:MAG: class I SAM-dependent methyltransferase, partial [Prevotellaceae bacterium]|nr:class I SAM-dependent methyltransferase [Prevotellaceae bacterium]
SKNKKAIAKGKVELVAASVEQIPYQDPSFDKICTINTLYFWRNAPQPFFEIRRVLLFNIVYTKEWSVKVTYTKYGFSKYSSAEITEQSGLPVEDIIEIEKDKSYCFITKSKSKTNIN